MTDRLWQEQHIWPCTLELATGAWLRSAGYAVAYEHKWDGLTPDWTVLGDAGRPVAFVEVHTDEPRQGVYGRVRAWSYLVQRIAEIPAPFVLTLIAPKRHLKPPDAKTAKKIARDLRSVLLHIPVRSLISSSGYTFGGMADWRTGGLLDSPRGIRASFVPPSEIAGEVSARRIAQNAVRKVGRYADLPARYKVPLIVATGAHAFTGVQLRHLDDLLEGNPTITFQFNYGDVAIGEWTGPLDRPTPWTMPPELSAIVWIDNRFPFTAAARVNPHARRPAHPAPTNSIQ